MRQRTNPVEVIRTQLEASGNTIEWLAERTGIGFWKLHEILEVGARPLELFVSAEIADALEVDLRSLIYATEAAAA